MKLCLVMLFTLVLSGCSYIDWEGRWWPCPKGQVLQPATRGMFGMVKAPSKCIRFYQVHIYDSKRRYQRETDFEFCRTRGKDGMLDAAVDACMAEKGW